MDNPPSPVIDRESCYRIVYDELFPLHPSGDRIGIETEMLALQSSTATFPAVVPFLQPEGKGLRTMLGELAQQEGWHDSYRGDEHLSTAALRLELSNGDSLTFEPGGQIEYSSQPHADLQTLLSYNSTVQDKLSTHLARYEIRLWQLGINPWHSLDDIGLQITKREYLLLDKHFEHFSPIGKRMMRQACTQQINLDCGATESVLAKRYLACNLLAPYVAAMFANSGVWERDCTRMHGFRTHIWRKLDNTRTGFPDLHAVARDCDRASCARAYLDFAMGALVIGRDNNEQRRISFQNWLDAGINGAQPTVDDFKYHLYTLYPEVRPRGYFEIRSIDCQSRIWQYVPLAFYLGIIYHQRHLERVLDALLPELGCQEDMMHVACYGLARADRDFRQRIHWLAELAVSGLAALPQHFRSKSVQQKLQFFFEHFTLQNKTPAADIQVLIEEHGKDYLCPVQLLELEESWAALPTK